MKGNRDSVMVHSIDRLSYMPETIQSHIVSYLPLKEAIRTSILSRRWREICCSLSTLDFQEYSEYGKINKDIIDHTLLLHNDSDIRCLKLYVEVSVECVSPIDLNRWVSFALRHNVAELSLVVSRGELQMLPLSLFTCRSLTTLELLSFTLKLPSAIIFPVLKKLILVQITFVNEYQANQIFSDTSCPVLENLEVSNCKMDHFPTLFITYRNLKFLNIVDDRFFIDETYVNKGIHFNLSNQNLHDIRYESRRLPEISSETSSSLFTATFKLYSPAPDSAGVENTASKVLTGMPSVRKLRLYGYFIQWLSRIQDLPACLPTSHVYLKDLSLAFEPTERQLQVITSLLRSYPNLRNLYLEFYEEDCIEPDMMPMNAYRQPKECPVVDVLKHLREVKIENFQGTEGEMDLVSYMLKNASNLKGMNITFLHKERAEDNRMQISEKLLSLPKVSPHASISLCRLAEPYYLSPWVSDELYN